MLYNIMRILFEDIVKSVKNNIINENIHRLIFEGINVSLSEKDPEMADAFREINKKIYGDKTEKELKDLTRKYTDSFKYHSQKGKMTKPEVNASIEGSVFPFGNAKLNNNTLIINLTSAMHCPSKKFCAVPGACYAVSGERQYTNVRARNGRNEMMFDQARENPNKWPYIFWFIEKYITTAEELGNEVRYVRLNESGDFKTSEDIRRFDEFAKKIKDKYGIITHCYTANEALKDEISKIKNIAVNASISSIQGDSVYRHFYALPLERINMMPDTSLLKISSPLVKWDDTYGWYYKCPCDIAGGAKCNRCKVCYDTSEATNDNGEKIPKYSVLCALHGTKKNNYNAEVAQKKRGITDDTDVEMGIKNIKKMVKTARKSENRKKAEI